MNAAEVFSNLFASVKNVFGKKSDTFENISLVENYHTENFQIENVESFYKLISKISAIPKSVNEITQTIISQPYKIRDKKSKKEINNVPPELQTLLDTPHEFYNLSELVILLILDLLISGNVWGYFAKTGKRLSVRRVDPRYVQFFRGEWIEDNPFGEVILLKPEYLIHVKYQPDPYNPLWGKGVIANNVTLFTRILQMMQFSEAFYKNGCHPTGVISIENGGAMDQRRIEAQLDDRQKGAKNAGRPLVLTGTAKFQAIQLDPTTLKISEELTILYKEAMAAFGLPRFLMEVGLKDAGQKYNNHALQMKYFLKSTVIPIAKRIESFFTNIVARFNPAWEFHFDINAEVYSAEELQAMLDAGSINREEHRKLMAMPVSKNKGLERFLVPSGLKTIEDVIEGLDNSEPIMPGTGSGTPITPNPNEPPKPPKEPPAPDKVPVKPTKKIDNGRERERCWRDEFYLSEPADKIWTVGELKADKNKKRIRQDFINLNAKTRTKKSKEAAVKFNLHLIDAYGNILAEFSKTEIGKGEKKDPAKIISEIYDEDEGLAKFEKISLPVYQSVGEATYSNTANVLTMGVAFNIADPGVAAKVMLLRKDGPLVTQTTRGKLTETIQAGIAEGKTHNEIAKDIWLRFVDDNNDLADEFSKIYRPGVKPKDFDAVMSKGGKLQSRASLIARTEVAKANRLFAAESMSQSQVVKTVTIINCEPNCPICGPHQNVEVTFEEAESISNLHPNCSGAIVPGTISAD
jgi:HK97 family phage portal protein